MSQKIHKAGECISCDTILFTPRVDPRRERNGQRVQVMLADGSTMDVSLCDRCAEEPDWDEIWGRVMSEWDDKNQIRQFGKGNFILAVVAKRPWKEVR